MLVFIGAIAVGATGAFFSDTAVSTGNTFAAGTLALKLSNNESGNGGYNDSVSSTWNFNGMAPGGTPSEDTVWLKNSGVIDGQDIGIKLATTTSTLSNTGRQMRITKMTIDGKNVLRGGAGAEIAEYEAPTFCDITVGGSGNPSTITSALSSASTGDVICATGTNYSSSWEGSSEITVNVSGVTLVTMQGPSVTKSIPFKVTAPNVTIKGFEINAPSGTYGVYVNSVSGVSVLDNHINDIGTSLSSGSAQAVYLTNTSTALSGFVVKGNTIENVGSTSMLHGGGSGSSAKGVYIGTTSGTGSITNVDIENNIIRDIKASTADWVSGGGGGAGAYGVLLNYTPGVSNLNVKGNTLTDMEGLWVHGIGLETNTPNAVVTLNDFSDFTDHKNPSDAIAVFLEKNTSGSTVDVNMNNFASDISLAVALHPTTASGAVDATNNWWGDFDPSDQISQGGGSIDTSSFAGGVFAGFVNGSDTYNSNGFADLQDLYHDPILNTGISLDAGEKKQFIMAVQLDGPTTGNEFQGQSLTTSIVFTLEQQ